MRWGGNRNNEHWVFRSVERPSLTAGRTIGQIVGGGANLSAFTDIKADGKIELKAAGAVDVPKIVRAYYCFTDDAGESVEQPVMTGLISSSPIDSTGLLKCGTASLRGLLCMLSDDEIGKPLVFGAGTNPVEAAKSICEAHGLTVTATPSSYTLRSQKVFIDTETTYLEVVNWLLDAANYSSAYTNAMGEVQMSPYVEPTMRPQKWTFRDDGRSAMKVTVTESDNSEETPNVIRAYFEDAEVCIFAEARNDDPSSPSSTVSTGRVNSVKINVEELDGAYLPQRIANMRSIVRKALLDKSTLIRYIEVPCLYIPLDVNDCIGAEVLRSGISFVGCITNVDVEFSLGAPCVIRARQLLQPDFKVTVRVEAV